MTNQKTIQKLKKSIKKKDDQISLLKLILKEIRKLQQKKSNRLEKSVLTAIEKELNNY